MKDTEIIEALDRLAGHHGGAKRAGAHGVVVRGVLHHRPQRIRDDAVAVRRLTEALWRGGGGVLVGLGLGLGEGLQDLHRPVAGCSEGGAVQAEVAGEGDPALANVYHVIAIDPGKWPKVNAAGAKAFADFLVGAPAQELIRTFGVEKYGAPLFFPDAGKSDN